MATRFSLHAEVFEVRARAQDGRQAVVPIALTMSEFTDDLPSLLELMQKRISRAEEMASAMLAARPHIMAKEPVPPLNETILQLFEKREAERLFEKREAEREAMR